MDSLQILRRISGNLESDGAARPPLHVGDGEPTRVSAMIVSFGVQTRSSVSVIPTGARAYTSDISTTVSNRRFLTDVAGTWLDAWLGSMMSADTARLAM